MQIVISGIPIDVQKKNIKNMHLQVKPPDGHVVISAPLSIDDKAIEVYARTNIRWVKKQIQKFQNQPRSAKRQYVSGETMYIWGKQYFIKFVPDNQKNSLVLQGDQVTLSMHKESTVKQRDNYVREQYRAMLKHEIERLLPKWEKLTGLKCDGWQTKYMVTRWGTCNTEKRKLWFNLQLVQKPIECLEYVILHELIHLRERKHNTAFITFMDMHMPNWREIRKELNDRKLDYYDAQDESPLKKLINSERYDDIKDAVLGYLETDPSIDKKTGKVTFSDIDIENVIHIEQPKEGVISLDVLVSCDIETVSHKGKDRPYFFERWLSVHCQVSVGIELTDFSIVSVGNCEPQEENDNDRFSGELVPIIARDGFEEEATRFLQKYYPEALENPVPVPIRKIAEEKMGLTIVEDTRLSEELSVFGMVIFEDLNITGKDREIFIRKAKRGTIFLDPRVYFEMTLGTVNSTIAHECYHWHKHQPYHALMKMIGANDDVGKVIQCSIHANAKDSEKWKAIDWMEWHANGIALKILMPYQTVRIKTDSLMHEYWELAENRYKPLGLERVIDGVAEYYGVSKQAAKARMRELGYNIVDGVYTYVNGRYIPQFSFSPNIIGKNQTFTVSATDLFKAYCFNPIFRKIIDTGKVIYTDGHLCINHPNFIEIGEDSNAHMTAYALGHVDECCLVFDTGYTYESKYLGIKYYNQFLTKVSHQSAGAEFSFEMNAHNRALLAMMDNAPKNSNVIRRLPGSFAESLVQLMAQRKMSNRQLTDASLVGEKTIQRLRNDEEYRTTKQAVLGLCVGLKLTLPEAEDLLDKSDFKLNTMKTDDYIYKCVLGICAMNSIYEINEMLAAHNVQLLGSSSTE